MENYIVSARKYRPASFDSVVGQESLTTTLKNSIASGRLAHAYLFCGPRGVGKTTCARIFAKTINCMHPTEKGEACNECESCKAFNEQRSYNIHELDAASNNSVDDIRALIEQVMVPPQIGTYKVFIVDEVHMLSQAAFNAFLKTLEEPPKHAIFILATTEKHKILPTILSRCQIYDFSRMSVENIAKHLEYVAKQENISYEPEAINIIAQKADGGMRDALSIFDQAASFCNGNITYQKVIETLNVLDSDYYFRLTDMLLENKVTDILLLFNNILTKGFQADLFINGLASHLRDIMVSKDEATLPLLEVTESARQRYKDQAAKCTTKFLFSALRLCNECDINYKASKNKRLQVELTLIQIAQLTQPDDSDSAGRKPRLTLKPIFKYLTVTKEVVADSSAKTPKAKARKEAATSQKETVAASTDSEKSKGPHALPSFLANSQEPTKRTSRFNTAAIAGMSMYDLTKVQEKKPDYSQVYAEREEQLQKLKTQSKPLVEDEVQLYWREFANRLPKEKVAMAVRMKNNMPKVTSDNDFIVEVNNIQVKEYMLQLARDIEAYIAKRSGNYNVKMSVVVSETSVKAYVMDPIERLKHMAKKNPSLLRLQKELGLDIIH